MPFTSAIIHIVTGLASQIAHAAPAQPPPEGLIIDGTCEDITDQPALPPPEPLTDNDPNPYGPRR